MTNRYANGFIAQGIRKGDHVAIMLGNRPEFFWASWGLGKLGAVSVPINTAAKGDLLRYFIDQSDSKRIIVDEECASRIVAVTGQIPKVEALLYVGPTAASESELRESKLPLTDLREMDSANSDTPDIDAVPSVLILKDTVWDMLYRAISVIGPTTFYTRASRCFTAMRCGTRAIRHSGPTPRSHWSRDSRQASSGMMLIASG
jgi:acyl-CoA synthetase (AMP-forming)/AMP-acid ligase II